jgi:hypothetical protein
MSTGTQIAKVHELTSTGTSRIARSGNAFTRFCRRLVENVGTGRRKPAHYSSMTLSQLEQRAQEDMAIAKAMGF